MSLGICLPTMTTTPTASRHHYLLPAGVIEVLSFIILILREKEAERDNGEDYDNYYRGDLASPLES
jgi:hypothetical protein